MAAGRGHKWEPKGARIQTCSLCHAEKWTGSGKPIYHLGHGRYGKGSYEVLGTSKEPPCVAHGQKRS